MFKNKKIVALVLVAIVIVVSGVVYFFLFKDRKFDIKPLTFKEARGIQTNDVAVLTSVATNLEVPWSMVFLPDKSLLFTERPGRVRLIDSDGNLKPEPIATIQDVEAINEGGLLGITIHPKFSENNYVYLHYTYDGETPLNRVVRYKYANNSLSEAKTIVDAIPGNPIHNGGRIKFGPDGYLYIAAGDSADPSLAQDKNSLAGKILRVTDEGQIPSDNPFGNPVYSMGHRNPQGLAWDESGRLWSTEHGQIATDELNRIRVGKNYGWPTIVGDQSKEGLEKPVAHSGDSNWAPSGATFFEGSIFFAGLRGQALYEAKISGDTVEVKEHLKGQVGRIRDVIVGPDGFLYISTSNKDGRNVPVPEDDRILRVNPSKL